MMACCLAFQLSTFVNCAYQVPLLFTSLIFATNALSSSKLTKKIESPIKENVSLVFVIFMGKC